MKRFAILLSLSLTVAVVMVSGSAVAARDFPVVVLGDHTSVDEGVEHADVAVVFPSLTPASLAELVGAFDPERAPRPKVRAALAGARQWHASESVVGRLRARGLVEVSSCDAARTAQLPVLVRAGGADDDECLASVIARGKTVLVTGDNPRSAPVFMETQMNVQDVVGDSASTGVQYISSGILFGLLLALLMLIMLCCGLSSLMSIETPLRFPTTKLPINKEF